MVNGDSTEVRDGRWSRTTAQRKAGFQVVSPAGGSAIWNDEPQASARAAGLSAAPPTCAIHATDGRTKRMSRQ
jgi:hypothetical protein